MLGNATVTLYVLVVWQAVRLEMQIGVAEVRLGLWSWRRGNWVLDTGVWADAGGRVENRLRAGRVQNLVFRPVEKHVSNQHEGGESVSWMCVLGRWRWRIS